VLVVSVVAVVLSLDDDAEEAELLDDEAALELVLEEVAAALELAELTTAPPGPATEVVSDPLSIYTPLK
jgi:hypothetical protein